jgi:hypothetical protein
MCSPSVVGAGSSTFDFKYLRRTGTSGKKAMNPSLKAARREELELQQDLSHQPL